MPTKPGDSSGFQSPGQIRSGQVYRWGRKGRAHTDSDLLVEGPVAMLAYDGEHYTALVPRRDPPTPPSPSGLVPGHPPHPGPGPGGPSDDGPSPRSLVSSGPPSPAKGSVTEPAPPHPAPEARRTACGPRSPLAPEEARGDYTGPTDGRGPSPPPTNSRSQSPAPGSGPDPASGLTSPPPSPSVLGGSQETRSHSDPRGARDARQDQAEDREESPPP